jgi:hypothetical protein
MPTGLFHTKVTFAALSGQAEDAATTSFSYIGSAQNSQTDEGMLIVSEFHNFINGLSTGNVKISDLLGKSLSRAVDSVKVSLYGPLTGNQLGGAVKGDASTYMGSPVYEDFITLVGTNGENELPRQATVDLVLRASGWAVAPIEAADGSDVGTAVDRPRQRKTGRMKLGPFCASAGSVDGSQILRPSSMLVTALLERSNNFRDALNASFNVDLAVWSRTNREMIPVTDVQVPNAFGNAIRRKAKVTARNTTAVG